MFEPNKFGGVGKKKGTARETRLSYGGRRRGTHLLGDQLDARAAAGSWQIADRYTMAS